MAVAKRPARAYRKVVNDDTLPSEPSGRRTATRDVVVIGASAGGIEALQKLVGGLQPDFPATLCVVVHSSPDYGSSLPQILSRAGPLPASHAVHGEPLKPGRIFVAPVDNHLTLQGHYLRVVRGPKDNGHRPAVDPLFRTAAREYGSRVVGVILSGTLSCGTHGLMAVKARGGLAVVQDPADAAFDSMPRSAMSHLAVDHLAPAQDMGGLLSRLVSLPLRAPEEAKAMEKDPSEGKGLSGEELARVPAVTCPECSGAMSESEEGGLLIFRCHVGHIYGLDSLINEQGEALEAALWASVRALEESADMARKMAIRGDRSVAQRFVEKRNALLQHADTIRHILLSGERLSGEPPSQLTREMVS